MKIKESFIKYYCGLFDADGWCSFSFDPKNYLKLNLGINASEIIDRNFKMLKYIEKEFQGLGNLNFYTISATGNTYGSFIITKRSDINMTIPRMLKHLVIKGKHCKRMFCIWKGLRGKILSNSQVERLKKYSKWSRQHNGPVKPKKHPTWAWLAGYIDGDAHLKFRYKDNFKERSPNMSLSILSHEKDRQGIDLINKAFKGNIYHSKNKPWLLTYERNLGIRDSSFVKRFLPKLSQYCIIKQYRIEQILAFHNKYHQQRLIEKNAKA
jgi:hypothetical protein